MSHSNQTPDNFSRISGGSNLTETSNSAPKTKKSVPLVSLIPKKSKIVEDISDEEEEDLDDSEEESEDESDSDDSIVVPDSEVVVEGNLLEEDDEDLESSRKVLELIQKEAEKFIGETPLKSTVIGNRVLRDRKTIKSPERPHLKLVNEAFEKDEKKELISIINSWKKKYVEQIQKGEIVMPVCNLNTSSLQEIRNAYKRVGSSINSYLNQDDAIVFSDEDSESESEEDMDDDDSSVTEPEEESDEESSDSSESEESDYDME